MAKNNHLTLNIDGVNLKRLIKTLYKNKIDVFNLNFISHKNLNITIKATDFKRIKSYLTDYKYSITKRYGLNFIKNYSILHLGLVFGIFIFLTFIFFNNNFLSKIYVAGNERIEASEVINYLSQNNIKQNTFFNKLNTTEIETNLETNFDDISLVSVIKKGTNLIINIKEKLYVEDVVSRSDIISKLNGQIIELNVVHGTSNYKVGDSVKVGDILVCGYTINDNQKVDCKAIATYKLKVWYSSSYNFLNEETVVERTGKVINNTYYVIFNKKLNMKVKKVNFENYEKEVKTSYIFNNLIVPIKLYSEKFYEIKENFIKNDFSLQKDAIIEKTTMEAKSKVPKNVDIQNITTEVVDVSGGKIITTYVETIQSF